MIVALCHSQATSPRSSVLTSLHSFDGVVVESIDLRSNRSPRVHNHESSVRPLPEVLPRQRAIRTRTLDFDVVRPRVRPVNHYPLVLSHPSTVALKWP